MRILIYIISALCVCVCAQAQVAIQEVLTNYEELNNSFLNKKYRVIKVNLPEDTEAFFYRITTFQPDKVNLNESLHDALRLVNSDKLINNPQYDFSAHDLKSNSLAPIDVYFFSDEKAANNFKSKGIIEHECFKLEHILTTTGKVSCQTNPLFVGIKASDSDRPVTVKVEFVSLSNERSLNAYDRYLYSIQNETNGEVVYEISGDRTNWEIFHLPSLRKADFKLAKSSVYLRVSTREKITVEYFIESSKKYRFFWNKELYRVDLAERNKPKP